MQPITIRKALELEEYIKLGPDPKESVQQTAARWLDENSEYLLPFDEGVREVLERISKA